MKYISENIHSQKGIERIRLEQVYIQMLCPFRAAFKADRHNLVRCHQDEPQLLIYSMRYVIDGMNKIFIFKSRNVFPKKIISIYLTTTN